MHTRIVPLSATTGRRRASLRFSSCHFRSSIFRAQAAHRRHFDPCRVQLSTLLSIKTGGCPEDCAYCPQSVHYDTGVDAAKLMDVAAVVAAAQGAQAAGATRFCMGAAWREPKDRDLDAVCAMVEGVQPPRPGKLRDARHADRRRRRERLKAAGLDYYNHNLDTSPEYLRPHHHHPHLSRPARHARPCARGRDQGVLRRHRRHGRKPRRTASA